jgi:3-deoxy-D-manno-octulosonic-acid transferase
MLIRPIISIAIVVARPFIPFFRKRLDFERKNFLEESSLAFSKADFCFEISSEGELEQVRPLIEAALSRQKKIEIIYSSPSVEIKCNHLYSMFPQQVRLLRLPLLSASPLSFLYFKSLWEWVKSPVVVFCRYDFFPELLLLKLFKKKFILVSGAFKKTSWYKLESFKLFDVVVAATKLEKKKFESLLKPAARVYDCDFRVPRIARRFQNASETLSEKTSLGFYIKKLQSIPSDKKIILGSAWASDLKILNDQRLIERVKRGDLHLLLAPHKLDNEHVFSLKEKCVELFGHDAVEVIDANNPYFDGSVVILQMGGILCELYSLFSIAYVGGGYERSIHSVLEPFFSNNAVVVGPSINRSTEYDLAFELAPSEIHVLKNPESFYTIIESIDIRNLNLTGRRDFLAHSETVMSAILKDILG